MSVEYIAESDKLTEFCKELLIQYGMSSSDALVLAQSLVTADMRGVKSHGVIRIQLYLDQIRTGSINVNARLCLLKETATTAVLDGDNGSGQVISQKAVALARDKAQKSGLSFVTVRRSNHFGAAGYWSQLLAGEDMIGFAATNTQPVLAAPAGKTAILGNNPFSVAIPSGKHAGFCLDIANGIMALGKIMEYQQLKKPFPENCWLDSQGNPTTDSMANYWSKFIGLPFGLHKGFGLAVIIEAITSLLADGAVAAAIPDAYEVEKKNEVTHSFVAINIQNFSELEAYKQRVDQFIDYLHQCPVREPGERIYYPGEIEQVSYIRSAEKGVRVAQATRDYLIEKAAAKGLDGSQVFLPLK